MGFFLIDTASRPALGHTQPRTKWFRGYFPRGYSGRGVKLNTPPSGAEIKNTWSCTSTPPIRLHGVVLS
jgi:hypothetical protein